MPRDLAREGSPRSHSTSTRNYRDRSDPPKRKDRDASEDVQPAKKKKVQPTKQENIYPSVNDLKRRIRDVKRLLNRVDLKADARIVQERALAGYEKELEDELARRDRSQLIKKYHFVRFLDRKAATKDLNRLLRREKELSKSDSDPASQKEKLLALEEKMHIARVNQNYTIYYPLTEKYISLYAAEKRKDSAAEKADNDDLEQETGSKPIHATTAEKPAMWHVVEKCMKDGTLDLLREGKLSTGEGENGAPAPEKKKSNSDNTKNDRNKSNQQKSTDKLSTKSRKTEDKQGKNSKRTSAKENTFTRANNNEDDDNESDGGFFEM